MQIMRQIKVQRLFTDSKGDVYAVGEEAACSAPTRDVPVESVKHVRLKEVCETAVKAITDSIKPVLDLFKAAKPPVDIEGAVAHYKALGFDEAIVRASLEGRVAFGISNGYRVRAADWDHMTYLGPDPQTLREAGHSAPTQGSREDCSICHGEGGFPTMLGDKVTCAGCHGTGKKLPVQPIVVRSVRKFSLTPQQMELIKKASASRIRAGLCPLEIDGCFCNQPVGHDGVHVHEIPNPQTRHAALPPAGDWGPAQVTSSSLPPEDALGAALQGLSEANLKSCDKGGSKSTGLRVKCQLPEGHEGPHRSGDYTWESEPAIGLCGVRVGTAKACNLPAGHLGPHQ